MERLTDYHVGENGAYMKCSGNCRGGLCENCEELEKIIDRLAAYEDTGLEPEDVGRTKLALMGKALAEIKELDGIPVDRMKELAQAEKDGRLVVREQGQWVESDVSGSMLSKCTVCGFRCGAYTFNFCPNCGAKMKEEANNEAD